MSDVRVTIDGHVGLAEICRAPNNFFDIPLIQELAGVFERFDADPAVRCIVLAAEGKNFCAGADFSAPAQQTVGDQQGGSLYQQGVRLFRCAKPIVAAVQGAAVGGGLGLSLVADFRVASPESRFTANFNRLGFHPGFGLSITLPRVVGEQKAAMLFYTGQRIGGEEAHAIGLVDVLVPANGIARSRPGARRRNRVVPRRSPWRPPARRCAGGLPTPSPQSPIMNWPNSSSISRPQTSRKASRRWPSGARRNSPGADPHRPAWRIWLERLR